MRAQTIDAVEKERIAMAKGRWNVDKLYVKENEGLVYKPFIGNEVMISNFDMELVKVDEEYYKIRFTVYLDDKVLTRVHNIEHRNLSNIRDFSNKVNSLYPLIFQMPKDNYYLMAVIRKYLIG